MDEKGQDHPLLTDPCWLTNFMFFTDYTNHFNVLNEKLKGFGKTTDWMFCDIKTFEKKIESF